MQGAFLVAGFGDPFQGFLNLFFELLRIPPIFSSSLLLRLKWGAPTGWPLLALSAPVYIVIYRAHDCKMGYCTILRTIIYPFCILRTIYFCDIIKL